VVSEPGGDISKLGLPMQKISL